MTDLVSRDQLHQLFHGLGEWELGAYTAPLNAALREFAVDTSLRIAAFLAQVGHESGGLRYWHEFWGPSDAQRGYEGRVDLGNTQPGDGYRYRGRGPIQLTGRRNYHVMGQLLDVPLEESPDLAAEPHVGFRVAGQFWASRGLNDLADRDTLAEFRHITLRVNGGLNGLDDRLFRWREARVVLGLPPLPTEAA